ncbi:MAG: ADP-ribosylglycohydrolase family protein [Candidatus Eisenbacteria bacterium]
MKDGSEGVVSRAEGCLLGQLAGDSLGSLVEFEPPEAIRERYPGGVRDLADGGAWDTIAGQPTDDSEMALALARSLIEEKRFDAGAARRAYIVWLDSGPFDCGNTVRAGLRGRPNPESQANGALMRVSPLGIFGASHPLDRVAEWAREDASITHPHPVCLAVNAVYASAIADAVRSGSEPEQLYQRIVERAEEWKIDAVVMEMIVGAAKEPPRDYLRHQGWVLIAFGNALWQLLHAENPEDGIIDTVMRGGDTDTNAAIAGALLGAVHGIEAIPARWTEKIVACRPAAGDQRVHQPRPERYWPADALTLARKLIDPSSS